MVPVASTTICATSGQPRKPAGAPWATRKLTPELAAQIVKDVEEMLTGLSLTQLAQMRDTGLIELHRLKENLLAQTTSSDYQTDG